MPDAGERGAQRGRCWIHGHTHDSFGDRPRDTRVVRNPHGCTKAGVNETPRLDPQFTVEV